MPKFKDPKTGQIVNVNNFLVFLSCLLFGLFFFLYIGETQHALVMVGAAILIALVTIFIHWTAILYSLIFPFIYSLIAPKIVKDKWLKKGYVALDDDLLIQAKQSLKDNIKDKKKVGIQFLATTLSLFAPNLSLFIIRIAFFPEFLYRFFYFYFFNIVISSIILAIPISICNLLRKPLLKLLSLPVNNYTNYSLTIFYLVIIVSVYRFFRWGFIAGSLSDLFFIICFPLVNIFIYQLIGNYFASDKKFSLNEIVYIFKHTSQELVNKTLGK